MNSTQIRQALRAIATGGIALPAATEYELEELALITTDDGPYAKLTDDGRTMIDNSVIDEPTNCPICGSDDLGVCCATEDREDEADIVACEFCAWEAPLTPEGAAVLA